MEGWSSRIRGYCSHVERPRKLPGLGSRPRQRWRRELEDQPWTMLDMVETDGPGSLNRSIEELPLTFTHLLTQPPRAIVKCLLVQWT